MKERIADSTCHVALGLSALCLLVTPLFSPAIVLAGFVGVAGALVASAMGARRLALVTVVFAAAPLAALFLIEVTYPQAVSEYLVIGPIAVVVIFAVFSARLLKTGRVTGTTAPT